MKKQRSPDMTVEVIKVIIDTLDGWNGKLTWALLIEAVAEVTGITYSRFTLAEYPQIANAFSFRKKGLKDILTLKPAEPRNKSLKAALEQIERYKSKIARLEQENQLLLEQFVTWAHNAERKGVTIMMLNATLPKPPREQSDGVV